MCQGPTVNFTPFVTGSLSQQHPYEPFYNDPVYDMRDLTGDFDANGNPTGDGAPDNPGDILYHVPTRTGQKNNTNLSVGFSMTWSTPLDKTLQDQCKKAAATQIALQQQLTANKRLDFEIARLKNCGNLLKEGIRFHPRSKYAAICADVVVDNVTTIAPHVHSISHPSSSSGSESPVSVRAEDLGAPLKSRSLPSSLSFDTFVITFLITGLNTLSNKSANGFANRAEEAAVTAIAAVVEATCAEGKYCATMGISS